MSFSLIALLFLIFWAEIANTSDFAFASSPSRRDLVAMGGVDGKLVFTDHEWWRVFTAPLLHASPSHIIGNTIALLFAGFILEPIVGPGWFGALFAVSALGARRDRSCRTMPISFRWAHPAPSWVCLPRRFSAVSCLRNRSSAAACR